MLIKQSTAKSILVYSEDVATGLASNPTASPGNLTASKNGGAAALTSTALTSLGSAGLYVANLSATDTNTVGQLGLGLPFTSGHRLIFPEIQIVPWDPESATNMGLSNISTSTALLATSAALSAFTGGGVYSAPDNTSITAIKAKTDNLPSSLKKNTARAKFPFVLTSSTDYLPTTGKTVTAQRSIDGAAFAPCGNAVVEVGLGCYTIDLTATDLNGDSVILYFTATGANPAIVPVLTTP